jgi:hypothetical protein
MRLKCLRRHNEKGDAEENASKCTLGGGVKDTLSF